MDITYEWRGDFDNAEVNARAGRQGIGTRLVEVAVAEARATDCEWLHVDFDDHLQAFYFETCGFRPVNAGLIRLA